MENYTNEELITLYRETNDEHIKDYFFEKNMNLAYYFANEYFIKPHTPEDEKEEIIAESMFGLVKAFDKFQTDKETKFSTYAAFAIRTSVLNYYFRNYKKKRNRLPTISLSESLNIDENLTIADMIEDENYIDLDLYTSVMIAQKDMLTNSSPDDKTLYKLSVIDGLTQLEIAEIVNKSQTHVSRKLKKIKNRLKECI